MTINTIKATHLFISNQISKRTPENPEIYVVIAPHLMVGIWRWSIFWAHLIAAWISICINVALISKGWMFFASKIYRIDCQNLTYCHWNAVSKKYLIIPIMVWQCLNSKPTQLAFNWFWYSIWLYEFPKKFSDVPLRVVVRQVLGLGKSGFILTARFLTS